MYKQTFSLFLILAFFAMLLTISGCNLVGGSNNNVQNIVENTITPTGSANVTFDIKAPAGQSTSIRGAKLTATPTVEVTLTIINNGSETETTWTLKKNAFVINGSATASFESVPEKSCVAAFSIIDGNIGGATEFHGSKDLVKGSNKITVVPVGSGDPTDNTTEMVKRLIANPSAVKVATLSFINQVNELIKAKDFSKPLAFENTFNEIIKTLKPAGLISITIDTAKNEFVGTDGGENNWNLTNSILTSTDFPNTGFESTVKPTGIFKYGVGNTAIVYFEDITNKAAAIVKVNSKTGNRIAALTISGKISHFLELHSGQILLAGISNNNPFVLNWDGTTKTILPTDASSAGIKWFKTYIGTNIPTNTAINKLINFGTKILLELKLPSTQIADTFDPSTGPSDSLTAYSGINAMISGIAVDPYLKGTKFFYDLNDDQKFQANEPLSTPTTESGAFTITGPITNAHDLLAQKDNFGKHLGKTFPFKLRTNVDFKDGNGKVIASPITSVAQNGLELSEIISVINSEFTIASIPTLLTENDIKSNPLDGLDKINVETLKDSDLLKIRAVIAIQQYLSVIKQIDNKDGATEFDYKITADNFGSLENRKILRAIAAIVKNACNVKFIRTSSTTINSAIDTVAASAPTFPGFTFSETHKTIIRDAIQIKAIDVAKTCVSIADYCSAEMITVAKAGGKSAINDAFITALTTKTSQIMVPDIGPRYYFQRIRATLETPPAITNISAVDSQIWNGIKSGMKFAGSNGSTISLETVKSMGNFQGIDVSQNGANLGYNPLN